MIAIFILGICLGISLGVVGMAYKEYKLATRWERTARTIEEWKKEGTDNGLRDGAVIWRVVAKGLRHSFPHVKTVDDLKEEAVDREIEAIMKKHRHELSASR